jgi:AmmeMemoRadiSam system protein A
VTPALDGRALLALARGAVAARLGLRVAAPPRAREAEPKRAVFVTVRRLSGALHGCIGTVEPTDPVSIAVEAYAQRAAFHDPRSRPLSRHELDDVRFEVSVLGPAETVACSSERDAAKAVEPGRHGVILSLGGRRGVFLPQVWETLPEPRTFLRRLRDKAGLDVDRWDRRIVVERFVVEKFHEQGYTRVSES